LANGDAGVAKSEKPTKSSRRSSPALDTPQSIIDSEDDFSGEEASEAEAADLNSMRDL
jgi:hypothetical protein